MVPSLAVVPFPVPFHRRPALPWALLLSLALHGLVLVGLLLVIPEPPQPRPKPLFIEFLGDLPKQEEPPPEEVEALSETTQRARTEKTSPEEKRATTDQPPAPEGAPVPQVERVEATPPAPPRVEPKPREERIKERPIAVERKRFPDVVVPMPPTPRRSPRRAPPAPVVDPLDLNVPLQLTPSLREIARLDRQRQVAQRQRQAQGGEATVDINTRELRYASYFRGVKQRVEGTWIYPSQARREKLTGVLMMQFTINREGRVVEIEVLDSSGAPILDQAAIEAVRKASPFGPLPESWNLDRITVRAQFEYISRGFRWRR